LSVEPATSTGFYTVGVDVGGTFTDLCLAGETGPLRFAKTLTTSQDPSEGIAVALEELLRDAAVEPSAVSRILHGTTLVTNAIIERRGAKTALLATAGFRDVVEIGRERRYELYDLQVELPRPLAPRYLRFDVPERMLANGLVELELDREFVQRLANELFAAGIDSIAVGFLHAFTNPRHELEAREIIETVVPTVTVSISTEVAPEVGEYERLSTTLANAYVMPLVQQYLRSLQQRLDAAQLPDRVLVMLSSGGLAILETAAKFPIRMLESGPAGGAIAAASFARTQPRAELLSFDMGGTTAKLCLIEDGAARIGDEFEVDRIYRLKPGSGLPVRVPSVDMIEIGAGGGSIAHINSLGLVAVGPESAGADPGPACYGRGGTQATVSDADLILGYLDPDNFLGGRMRLDRSAALRALEEHISCRLGASVEEAAAGIHLLVNEQMANAARAAVVERGRDPRTLPLYSFGGAGPTHAAGVAASLGSPSIFVPYGAGVLSAIGFLGAPIAFHLVRSCLIAIETSPWSEIQDVTSELEEQGQELLGRAGVQPEDMTFGHTADLRHAGQGHAVRVALPHQGSESWRTQLRDGFEHTYVSLYGHQGPDVDLELIRIRVTASGTTPQLRLDPPKPPRATPRPIAERKAYFAIAGEFVETPVWERSSLPQGTRLSGPAIVQEPESTTVLPPGDNAHVTPEGALHIIPGTLAQ
jgi:N-methylhydantoinase A